MLVLTRQQNEKIILSDEIEIIIVDILGNKVKIGFKAPSEIKIYREEIYLRMQKEKLHLNHY